MKTNIQYRRETTVLSTPQDDEVAQKPIKTNGVAKRYTILKREKFRCHYCQEPLNIDSMTIDHKTPKALSGGNELENLVASCINCNQLKGAIPYEVFMEAMQGGYIEELLNDHRALLSAIDRVKNQGTELAKKIVNHSAIVRSIGRHLEKGQINLDILEDLEQHIEMLGRLKNEYEEYACLHAPDF